MTIDELLELNGGVIMVTPGYRITKDSSESLIAEFALASGGWDIHHSTVAKGICNAVIQATEKAIAERGPVPTPHPLDDWEFDVNTQKFTRITEAGNNVGIYIYSHEAGWGVLYDGGARVYGTLDDAIYIANRIAEANGGWADKEVEKETEGLLDEVLVEVET